MEAAINAASLLLWVARLPWAGLLVRELGLEEKGYRLVIYGGPNQDIPQLHFHLVSGA